MSAECCLESAVLTIVCLVNDVEVDVEVEVRVPGEVDVKVKL